MSTHGSSVDVIGDLHGCTGPLRALLARLGFRNPRGRWTHPESRRIAFLGDYVDRGPDPYGVYRLVRELCEQGMAVAILGNHETNAIQFCARARERRIEPREAWRAARSVLESGAAPQRGWLRDHARGGPQRISSNLRQHRATIEGMTADQYAEFIDWARRLPAWVEFEGRLRLVHAAWIAPSIGYLERWTTGEQVAPPSPAGAIEADPTPSPSLGIVARDFESASAALCRRLSGPTPYSDDRWCDLVDVGEGVDETFRHPPDANAAIALERLTKGVEIALPAGAVLTDLEGHARRSFRARWYRAAGGVPIERLALLRRSLMERQPPEVRAATVIERGHDAFEESEAYPSGAPPVLFGHYGLACEDLAATFDPKCACVDYSGFHDGALHAYRWDGEFELSSERFASVPGQGTGAQHD